MNLQFFDWRKKTTSSKIEVHVPTVDGDEQALPGVNMLHEDDSGTYHSWNDADPPGWEDDEYDRRPDDYWYYDDLHYGDLEYDDYQQ